MKENKHIIDPTFLRDSSYSYVNCDINELSSVLSFALARHEKDLILHQQRIELYAKDKNPSLLFSALVDLFTALQNKGLDYKKRMLNTYIKLLSKQQANILLKSVDENLMTKTYVEDLHESVLNLGIQGDILSPDHLAV